MSAQSKVVMPASAKAIMSPAGSSLTDALWLPDSCHPPRITREIS